MQVIVNSKEKLHVTLDKTELFLFNNSLNEVINGPNKVADEEFQIRLGATKTEAVGILAELNKIL